MTNKVRVGLLGLGTVGTGLVKLLNKSADKVRSRVGQDIEIAGIAVKDPTKPRDPNVKGYTLCDDPLALCSDPNIDIIVELIGGIDESKRYVTEALEKGKRVVTANKALLAEHGRELLLLAKQSESALYFEAAVAGGIPIVHVLESHLFSDDIYRVEGILNGTSHFILSEMSEKQEDFTKALAKAQALGYAEQDPTHDVELVDATHKLAILTEMAFGKSIDWKSIPRHGITQIRYLDMRYANEFGFVIKPVACMQQTDSGRLWGAVEPMLVPQTHELASTAGVMNAVNIRSLHCVDTFLTGPGAGEAPTATSVLADLVRAARKEPFDVIADPAELITPEENTLRSEFYTRIVTKHQVGMLAKLTELFAECDINIKAIHQDHVEASLKPDEKLVVVLSEPLLEKQILLFSDKLKSHFPKEDTLILRLMRKEV